MFDRLIGDQDSFSLAANLKVVDVQLQKVQNPCCHVYRLHSQYCHRLLHCRQRRRADHAQLCVDGDADIAHTALKGTLRQGERGTHTLQNLTSYATKPMETSSSHD